MSLRGEVWPQDGEWEALEPGWDEENPPTAPRPKRLVVDSTPWVYSGILHMLLCLLLLDVAFRGDRDAPPPPRQVEVALLTMQEGDDGDEGEAAELEEAPEAEASETESPDPEPQPSAPVQAAPPPRAPKPDPVRREVAPPTTEELDELFGLGGSPQRTEGPEDAASDPEATSLLQALLSERPKRGTASPYGSRTVRGRTAGVRKNGGTPGSESAVEAGLDWLHRHQSGDGAWQLAEFGERCPHGDACDGKGYGTYDVGGTGLALLAFLGAGYHHRGDGANPGDPGFYSSTVSRGIQWLLRQQNLEGDFGPRSSNMYCDAIATLALVEAYALSQDPALRRPIRAAVRYLTSSQEPRGGWNYSPQARSERNDTSITGWVMMALHGAEVVGFPVPAKTMSRARRFMTGMTSPDGRVSYADTGQLAFRDSLALVPVGLFTTLLCGGSGSDSRSLAQRRKLDENPPTWTGTTELDTSLYYVYYGTLAQFFLGGDSWERWNEALLAMLLPTQRRAGHLAGSWDPIGKWAAKHGGRIYSTALAILCLEIYYKYRPSYLSGRASSFPETRPRLPELPIRELPVRELPVRGDQAGTSTRPGTER